MIQKVDYHTEKEWNKWVGFTVGNISSDGTISDYYDFIKHRSPKTLIFHGAKTDIPKEFLNMVKDDSFDYCAIWNEKVKYNVRKVIYGMVKPFAL